MRGLTYGFLDISIQFPFALILIKSLVLPVKKAKSLVDLGGYFMKIWIKDQSPNPAGKKFHNCSLLNSWTKVSLIFKHSKDRMIAVFTWTWKLFSHTCRLTEAAPLDHFLETAAGSHFFSFSYSSLHVPFFISLLLTVLIAECVLIQSLLHILVFQLWKKCCTLLFVLLE